MNLQWNVSKHFGLFLLVEYSGTSLAEYDEETITYSFDSLEKGKTARSYSLQAFTLAWG